MNTEVMITHPYHPFQGQSFTLHRRVRIQRDEAVACCVTDGRSLSNIPIAWTNLRVVDDFERLSSGRSYFRVDDLLELCELVKSLQETGDGRDQK